jgi:hypothetical protein
MERGLVRDIYFLPLPPSLSIRSFLKKTKMIALLALLFLAAAPPVTLAKVNVKGECQLECLVEWAHRVVECRELPPEQRDLCLQQAAAIEMACIGACPPMASAGMYQNITAGDGCSACCGDCTWWVMTACCCWLGGDACFKGGCYPVQCACGCQHDNVLNLQFQDKVFGRQTFRFEQDHPQYRLVCRDTKRHLTFAQVRSKPVMSPTEYDLPRDQGHCRTMNDTVFHELLKQKDTVDYSILAIHV